MSRFSHYDLTAGFEIILSLYAIITVAVMGLMSVQLFKHLHEQDVALTRGTSPKTGTQVFLVAKTAILWVIGYKGEEREKTNFDDVDVAWMDRHRRSIVCRFVPVYALYILALVVWTRPVYFDNGGYHAFRYSADQVTLLILFLAYVSSNIFFDYNSLRITFSNFAKARASRRYVYYLSKNLLSVSGPFFLAQIVSCVLWYYKRRDPTFPALDDDLLHKFMEISLWPYSFATSVNSSGLAQLSSTRFPGQLLITGIVFFPTVMLVATLLVYSAFLNLTQLTKSLLISHKLDNLCRAILRVRLIGIFEEAGRVRGFGYCNLAFLAVLDLSLVALVGALFSRFV